LIYGTNMNLQIITILLIFGFLIISFSLRNLIVLKKLKITIIKQNEIIFNLLELPEEKIQRIRKLKLNNIIKEIKI